MTSNNNLKVIQKLREDIQTTTENLENVVPDDDGLVLKMGRNILLIMYTTLVELMRREIVRLNKEIKEMSL